MGIFQITRRNGDVFTVLVDDSDLLTISPLGKWRIHKPSRSATAYVHRYDKVTKETVSLHRFLMGFPEMDVDHINGNGLDNRRENLRLVTKSQNAANFPVRKDNTSGFKGVDWVNRAGKWRARIAFDGKHCCLGYFETKEDAYSAYCFAAARLHKEFQRPAHNDPYRQLAEDVLSAERENKLFRATLENVNRWIVRGGHDLGELAEILDSIGGQ